MVTCFRDSADLAAAVSSLIAIEARFGAVFERHGLPPLRRTPEGFEELLRLVTEQAISLKAAERIWARLTAAGTRTPEQVLCLGGAKLVALGLSGGKARCFLALAGAAAEGRLPIDQLGHMTDEQAHAQLIAIPGIGPWTADNYLLSALGRADAWPSGDIALQEAARDLLDLAARPAAKALTALAEPWRPWRAAAARLLWSHYRHLKRMPQNPSA